MRKKALENGGGLKTKHHAITNSLAAKIKSGEYRSKIPGIREIAQTYNVHVRTASKAVKTLVNRNLLYMEKGRGTFVNKSLVKDKKFILWLLAKEWFAELPEMRMTMIKGLKESIENLGFEPEIRMLGIEDFVKKDLKNALEQDFFQGVVTTGISLKEKELLKNMKDEGMPSISLLFREEGVNYVDSDRVQGACEVVSYLISLGHRRIGQLTNSSDIPNARDNLAGYKKALAAQGIEFDPEMIIEISGEKDIVPAAHELYSRKATALFCFGDAYAIPVIEDFADSGIRVPQDISIAGFDDISLSRYCHPSLTTVRQSLEEIGMLAGKKLIQLIRGEIGEVAEILPCKLIIRDSTAKARKTK